jgi:hypothetical protein
MRYVTDRDVCASVGHMETVQRSVVVVVVREDCAG